MLSHFDPQVAGNEKLSYGTTGTSPVGKAIENIFPKLTSCAIGCDSFADLSEIFDEIYQIKVTILS